MRILVLGAGGFLGQAVVRRLASEGHQLTCVVRNLESAATHEGVRYIEAVLDDIRIVMDVAKAADRILHFAWDTTPGTSSGQPTLEVIHNLMPTLRLLEAMNCFPVRSQFIFVSSAGATYAPSTECATETSQVNPSSYYGAAKLSTEMFLRAYSAQSGNPVVVVRPSNVYGPGQKAKRQFGIVPTMMRAIQENETFQIWGDGGATRDYLFVDDFVEFFVALLSRQWHGFHLFNVASGAACSINRLCQLLEKISGKRLSVEYVPARGVDSGGRAVDSTKARDELGWRPRIELEAGLTETWCRFKSRS